MAILPGTHLGPYEIPSAIGAGGMDEVYKARDARFRCTVPRFEELKQKVSTEKK